MDDLAKLLYQGVMGMDHLLGDRERFLNGLRQEWERLDLVALPEEALLELVHTTDPVARLNLRPIKAAGLSLSEVGTLLADQPLKRGRRGELLALWEEAMALARAGRIPFRADELAALGEALRAGGHPPGHSVRYRELNRPAYRLAHDVADPAVRDVLARAGLSSDLP